MDIGGKDFTSNIKWRQRYFQDGCRPVIFNPIYESGFLPAFGVWILIGISVWVSGKDRLTLCNIMSSLFGLNLQTPSERCKTQGLFASLLFQRSITSTFHIWTCTYLGLQLFIGMNFYFLFSAPGNVRIASWTPPYVNQTDRKIDSKAQSFNKIAIK